ncbi:hypothetical protein, partial [Aeromonas veronii]|uniref:hypothetical protein n=1 Tax=Aeromonas veronii TaxID=654 RepID=UPI003D2578A9
VSMMVDLKVMAYFKISLSTRNWDRAKQNRPSYPGRFCFVRGIESNPESKVIHASSIKSCNRATRAPT